MKRLLFVPLLLLLACASLTPLQVAQQSHDYLALAQDTEARICWNVPNVAAAIAANVTPNRCTSSVAVVVGLTDERHRAINAEFATALELHRSATLLLASGARNVDLTALQAAIRRILDLVAQLRVTPEVASLQVQLEKAGAQ